MDTKTAALIAITFGQALACLSHPTSPTSSARTSSAQQYASGSSNLRTVDNAGYVDPGGRTAQVSQGGATVSGRGNNLAPTNHEFPTESSGPGDSQTALPPSSAAAPADATELRERASRALCDRESDCGRIGADKSFESADACMAAKRERVRSVMREDNCNEVRGDRVASCLTAIRREACGPSAAPLQPPTACTAQVLCM